MMHHQDRLRRPSRPLSFSYSVYGLHLRTNLPISRLNESPVSSPVDVQVSAGQWPSWCGKSLGAGEKVFYISPKGEDEHGNPRVVMSKSSAKSYFRIRYADGVEFLIDEPGAQVWAIWPDDQTADDVMVYLLGPIMGFVLRRRGLTSLHASAVVIDDRAVAFVGPPGAGKSTTAAAFAGLGHSVVSDDIVPLLDRGSFFEVQSGYPCVCLWPHSVSSLYGSPDVLPLLTPTWDKRYLPLGDDKHRFQDEPLPLAGVYMLGKRLADPARPFVEPVPPGQGLMALVSNTYMNYIPDSVVHAREFELLARLAELVPVQRVQPHDDPVQLTRLCDLIIEDVRGMASSVGVIRTARQNQHA